VNQLLTELDGLDSRKDVFVVAATNRPDIIDPAMLRPGRLDKLLYVPLPSAVERQAILQTLLRKTPVSKDVDISAIASDARCARFTGADLAGLVREACIVALKQYLASNSNIDAAKENHPKILVYQVHFMTALSKTYPSVSEVDERSYNSLQFKLRGSRSQVH
jgi:ribosome biogenesis ATPase